MKSTGKDSVNNVRIPGKIQIVESGIPVENTAGNSTYLLDFIDYLCQVGFEVEYVVLKVSPNGKIPWCIIPSRIRSITSVVARSNLRIGGVLLRFNSLSDWAIAPLRLAYIRLLPKKLKSIYYSAKKELQQRRGYYQVTPQAGTGFPTPEEVAFASIQFVRFKPDVVVVNYAVLGSVLDAIPSSEPVLKVILTHDILYKRFANLRKIGLVPELLEWDWDQEATLLRKAQVLLAIQEEEAKVLKQMAPSSEVICMPMAGVWHSLDAKQVNGRCLFVGSASPHNLHGLQWFLESVWPVVLQSTPNCSLHVCGSVCDQIQGRFPSVRFLGRVANLKPEYGAAQVCLVPLLVGSGLKIKLVEALSYGRACVSTSIGVQGLPDVDGKAAIVADTAADFAAAVHLLLSDLGKRQQMEAQCRYVTERLSPQLSYQPFVERIHQHLHQTASKL